MRKAPSALLAAGGSWVRILVASRLNLSAPPLLLDQQPLFAGVTNTLPRAKMPCWGK